MITLRSLISALVAVSFVGLSAAAQKKAPEPKAEPMTEAAALAVLNSDAGVQEKARACQELAAMLASPKAVPALAALLEDEHLSDYARSGLENIPDASAGAALRAALGKLNGRQLAGVVNSLGVRRDKAAVGDLRKLALDVKRGVASEAVASLGTIGTTDAADTLKKVLADGPANLRIDAAHASLRAAAQLAKDGNPAAARALLDQVVRSLPPGHLPTVARNQAATLAAARRK